VLILTLLCYVVCAGTQVIPIDVRGNIKDSYNLRLDELTVIDIKVCTS
jgi:hypothetical protein